MKAQVLVEDRWKWRAGCGCAQVGMGVASTPLHRPPSRPVAPKKSGPGIQDERSRDRQRSAAGSASIGSRLGSFALQRQCLRHKMGVSNGRTEKRCACSFDHQHHHMSRSLRGVVGRFQFVSVSERGARWPPRPSWRPQRESRADSRMSRVST